MQYQAKSLLLLILFFRCSSGFSSRHSPQVTNGNPFSRDAKDSQGFSLGRGLELLRLGKRDNILSSLELEGDSVLERIKSSMHSLGEPVISKSHRQTVRDNPENNVRDVNDGIDIEVLGDWPRYTDFNYISSRTNKQINKRQLPMLRLGKPSANQESPGTEDQIKLYMIHHGNGYFQGIDGRESDEDNVRLAKYSVDEEEQPDLSMLRLGKRQLPMLRLGKRQLPMLRLGKRQLPMLRLGKRQLPMLRLGKRQLPMLRLGKRQLPMLRLGKRMNDRYGEPEEPFLERFRFETPETPELELAR